MTFYELENICKKRKIKKFFYIIFIVLLLIIITILGFFILNITKTAKKNTTIKKEKIIIQKHTKPTKVNKQEIMLEPIIPDIKLNLNNNAITKKKEIKKTTKIIKEKNISKPKNIQNSVVKIETLPSFEKCINLAKKYLKEKNYALALKWAKNANIQNRVSPESWIISAKALFFSGKKEKAKEILRIYLKYNENKKIRNLLKEFENEKNN